MDHDIRQDAELVAATLSGDHEAYGKLYDRYARLVRVVVAGVSGDWAGVDDMVQESFLRGFRKLASLRQPSQFASWIAGIARQIGRERRRCLRRDRHTYLEPAEWEVPSNDGGQVHADESEQLSLVMRRMESLEERERLAVHAFFIEQREPRLIADALGLSRSGFYALVQRAVARLAVPSSAHRPSESKGR